MCGRLHCDDWLSYASAIRLALPIQRLSRITLTCLLLCPQQRKQLTIPPWTHLLHNRWLPFAGPQPDKRECALNTTETRRVRSCTRSQSVYSSVNDGYPIKLFLFSFGFVVESFRMKLSVSTSYPE